MSHLRIFFVILVHRTLWGSIQDRRTSGGRLYHCATATGGGYAKLLTFELHKGCPIYATLVSTQVRVPPGARNFYRPKCISFLPFLLSLFVLVETSTLFSFTRALPRDKEDFLRFSEYQCCLSHWASLFLKSCLFFDYYFGNFCLSQWGRSQNCQVTSLKTLPLGHGDCWMNHEVTQLYIGNPWWK